MGPVRIYAADIRQLKQHEGAALPLLTPARRARAEQTRVVEDRLHTVAAGLLLRRVLGVTADQQLRTNEQGRPELAGEGPCFSLSHGGDFAVLAVCSGPVGVDIEPVGERIPIPVPRRFLHPEELAWLEEERTPARFAWLWTRLESALKADGRGFAAGERTFSVLEDGPWHVETLLWEGHCISCAAADPFETELTLLPVTELLKEEQP